MVTCVWGLCCVQTGGYRMSVLSYIGPGIWGAECLPHADRLWEPINKGQASLNTGAAGSTWDKEGRYLIFGSLRPSLWFRAGGI